MATKRQHFVPRVYLKAWETKVETIKEPTKKFDGVYIFNDNNKTANGANRNSVLWKPHLYTVEFKNIFFVKNCLKIRNDFVDKIFDIMKNNEKMPLYAIYNYSVIKTKNSIIKYLDKISDWKFYYEDGNIAKQKSIMNQIYSLKSYVLEDAFDENYENYWESVYSTFIEEVRKGKPVAIGKSERIISMDVARNMLKYFFMFLCRSSFFDAMGIYTAIKNKILYPIFQKQSYGLKNEYIYQQEPFELTEEGKELMDSLMDSLWYSELYKMIFRKNGGFYHTIYQQALERCQMILFEAYEGEGSFITTDNPAFEHKSFVTNENNNGLILPITPKYLLFIGKGSDSINIVDYRMADKMTIKMFNRIIASYKNKVIIANVKQLEKVL